MLHEKVYLPRYSTEELPTPCVSVSRIQYVQYNTSFSYPMLNVKCVNIYIWWWWWWLWWYDDDDDYSNNNDDDDDDDDDDCDAIMKMMMSMFMTLSRQHYKSSFIGAQAKIMRWWQWIWKCVQASSRTTMNNAGVFLHQYTPWIKIQSDHTRKSVHYTERL